MTFTEKYASSIILMNYIKMFINVLATCCDHVYIFKNVLHYIVFDDTHAVK